MQRFVIDFVLRWIAWLLSGLGLAAKPRFRARVAETTPNIGQLADDDFVIVQSGDYLKWACFRCPCGCGEKISLSLATNRRPSWRITTDWLARPTVYPSVWQRAGCYGHFWIRKGAVDWCPGTGTPYHDDGL